MSRTYEDVLHESISKMLPVGVRLSKHACQRIVERKIDVEFIIKSIKTHINPKVCELIFDAKIRYTNTVQVKLGKHSISLRLVEGEYPFLIITTIY